MLETERMVQKKKEKKKRKISGIASITSIHLDRERKESHVQIVPRSTSFHIGVKIAGDGRFAPEMISWPTTFL